MTAVKTREMSLRLGRFYVATFAVIGLHLPFFPVYLAHRGFNADTIGLVLAVPLLSRVFSAPAIAFTADRLDAHRDLLIVLCLGAATAFALFELSSGLMAVLAVATLFAVVWTSVIPMAESLATAAVRGHGIDYGRIRSFGSLAFILASFGGGWAIERFGGAAAYWVILATLAMTVPAAVLLPRPPSRDGPSPVPLRLADAGRLLSSPIFLLLLLAVTLIQSAHALLYAFGSLHWQSTGISATTIGLLWAIGTGAEIFLFNFASWPLRRFGPLNLILIGGAVGTLRWIATALDPPASLLFFVQLLHALTFGATHLGAIYLLAGAVPQRLGATAQGLHSAMVGGLGLGGVIMISGPLYDTLAGRAFLIMAGLSTVGLAAGILMSRHWDGRPVIEDASITPRPPDPVA
jgi:PPP family 3-phenylpropionic acid transporter